MLPLLAAVATGLSVAVLLIALARPRTSAAEARLAGARREFARTGDVLPERPVAAAGAGERGRAAMLLPAGMRARLARSLASAGSPLSVDRFVTVTLVSQVVGAFAGLAVSSAAPVAGAAVFGVAGGLVLGAVPPLVWLRGVGRRRRLLVWRSLPDTSDLLTTCVEAGMSIDAAFARVAEDMPGPLSDEIRTMLREVALGRPRHLALADIGVRCGVPDLTAMLTAVIQADESGTSLGAVLRAQAHHIRIRRKLLAEEKARKVPAKMTFPIIFLIVPTLFILILGPLAIEIMETFQ